MVFFFFFNTHSRTICVLRNTRRDVFTTGCRKHGLADTRIFDDANIILNRDNESVAIIFTRGRASGVKTKTVICIFNINARMTCIYELVYRKRSIRERLFTIQINFDK